MRRKCGSISFWAVSAMVLAAALPSAAMAQQSVPPADESRAQLPAGSDGPHASVFLGDYLTIAIGAGIAPTHDGSDNYDLILAPRIAGSIGGVDFSSPGGGLAIAIDLVNERPDAKFAIIAGPAFRLNLNRNSLKGIEDEVVRQLGKLDAALELGAELGLRFKGLLSRSDSLTLCAAAMFDVAGAHESTVITPSIR